MATIIVTGASGFVGRYLLPMLDKCGHRVIATSRRPLEGTLERDPNISDDDRVVWRQLSAESTDEEYRDVIRQGDYVIHLAARVHMMHKDPQKEISAYVSSNTQFTKQIARVAAEQDVKRFVFVSTIKVLGEKTLADPFGVASPENPQGPYSESKHLAEIALREICSTAAMEFVIVRPVLVVGEGARGNLERLVTWVASGWPIPLGGICNRRSLLSVETLCQVLTRSLENAAIANKTCVVADPDPLSTPDIIRALARGYGKRVRLFPIPRFLIGLLRRTPVIGGLISRLSDSLVADPSQTFADLGWLPERAIQESLEEIGQRVRARG